MCSRDHRERRMASPLPRTFSTISFWSGLDHDERSLIEFLDFNLQPLFGFRFSTAFGVYECVSWSWAREIFFQQKAKETGHTHTLEELSWAAPETAPGKRKKREFNSMARYET